MIDIIIGAICVICGFIAFILLQGVIYMALILNEFAKELTGRGFIGMFKESWKEVNEG